MEEMSERPAPQIQEPVADHTHTFIFLHGGGSDGPQLFRAIRRMRPHLFVKFPSFRWVFPSSGLLWSNSMEIERKQWLDAAPLDELVREIPGLNSSVEYVLELIEKEVELLGGRTDRLVLGGISQGQATSLHVLLRCKHRLGAYVGMSGWLPMAHKLEVEGVSRGRRDLEEEEATPVFLGHGTHDRKVPLHLALTARRVLSASMKVDITWRQYVGAKLDGHWIKEPEELQDVADFLQAKLHIEDTAPRIQS